MTNVAFRAPFCSIKITAQYLTKYNKVDKQPISEYDKVILVVPS